MKLSIRVFGQLKDIIGSDHLEMVDVNDIEMLRARLKEKYPKISSASFAVSVDRKIINGNVALTQGSEVALLPPFSGG